MPTIKYATKFLKDAKRLKKHFNKIAEDIKEVAKLLESGKAKGDLIQGLSGLQIFKIRQKNSSTKTGKSGGFRVIYYQILDNEIIMLTIYSKTEKGDISREEILEILKQ